MLKRRETPAIIHWIAAIFATPALTAQDTPSPTMTLVVD